MKQCYGDLPPPEENDRHYLPATSFAGGKYGCKNSFYQSLWIMWETIMYNNFLYNFLEMKT